jgi:hypothetical protein
MKLRERWKNLHEGMAAPSERMPKVWGYLPTRGVNNISGGTLEQDAKKKTGKTMQELTDEKRKRTRQEGRKWRGRKHQNPHKSDPA